MLSIDKQTGYGSEGARQVDEVTWITDGEGRIVAHPSDLDEPLPSSVVLTEGLHGSAWQRANSADQKWYTPFGSQRRTWEELLTERNLVLVYDAAPRVPVSGNQGGHDG